MSTPHATKPELRAEALVEVFTSALHLIANSDMDTLDFTVRRLDRLIIVASNPSRWEGGRLPPHVVRRIAMYRALRDHAHAVMVELDKLTT